MILTILVLYRRSTTRGLTLLELLTALLIASVLSSTALLGYERMAAGWRLNAAVRQVTMDLKVARSRAIAENTPQRIHFEIPSASYQRQRQRAPGEYVELGSPVALPDGIQVTDCTARDDAVTFQPRGHASTFGTLTLRDQDGRERLVIVDIAGRLRVEG